MPEFESDTGGELYNDNIDICLKFRGWSGVGSSDFLLKINEIIVLLWIWTYNIKKYNCET